MADIQFDTQAFLTKMKPILRRRKWTYASKDSLNQFIFLKRLSLDPGFVIPQTHINRMQPVVENSSDSAQSDVDSDEDSLSLHEQMEWIDSFIGHIETVLNLLNNNVQRREFGKEFANVCHLTAKQRTRLQVL